MLGRASNLPTVWSNCLAGWILGGGGAVAELLVLCAGMSLIYTGGMYLNDAFDVTWDVDHKHDRPIPAGFIKQRTVWILGWSWLLAGLGVTASLGAEVAILAGQLCLCVIAYDAWHKQISWAPFLMAACRSFLLLAAAAAGSAGVDGLCLWTAVMLGAYIVGLSYLARAESLPGLLRYWPLVLLAGPVLLAVLLNDGAYRGHGLAAGALFLGWTGWSLKFVLGPGRKQIGAAVSGLLAGICLVDLLAVAAFLPGVLPPFLCLFALALAGQRFIPAT